MAGMNVIACPSAITLTGNDTQTVLQITAPSNIRLRIQEAAISFDGIDGTEEPIEVRIARQSTAGSGGTSLTLVKADDSLAETVQSTALHTITTEPTTGDILRRWLVHPQTGITYPIPLPDLLMVGGGDRLGIVVVTPAGVSPDCTPYFAFEE